MLHELPFVFWVYAGDKRQFQCIKQSGIISSLCLTLQESTFVPVLPLAPGMHWCNTGTSSIRWDSSLRLKRILPRQSDQRIYSNWFTCRSHCYSEACIKRHRNYSNKCIPFSKYLQLPTWLVRYIKKHLLSFPFGITVNESMDITKLRTESTNDALTLDE